MSAANIKPEEEIHISCIWKYGKQETASCRIWIPDELKANPIPSAIASHIFRFMKDQERGVKPPQVPGVVIKHGSSQEELGNVYFAKRAEDILSPEGISARIVHIRSFQGHKTFDTHQYAYADQMDAFVQNIKDLKGIFVRKPEKMEHIVGFFPIRPQDVVLQWETGEQLFPVSQP